MQTNCNEIFWIGNDPPPSLRKFSKNSSVLAETDFPNLGDTDDDDVGDDDTDDDDDIDDGKKQVG